MKKILLILTAFLLILVSCGKGNKDDYYNVNKKFAEMKSYAAAAEITVYRDKGSSKYDVKQYYKQPDMLRIETISPEFLKGKISVYSKGKGYEYNPIINDKIEISSYNDVDLIYLGILQKSILTGEDAKYSDCSKDGKNYIKITASIPDGNKYKKSVALYVTRKEYYPEYMEILDENSNVRVSVKYSEFIYNPNISDDVFKI